VTVKIRTNVIHCFNRWTAIGSLLVILAGLVGCESAQVASATAQKSIAAASDGQEPPAPNEILRAAALQPVSAVGGEGWHSMFDGSSFTGWRVTEFGEGGRVELKQGLMVFRMGAPFTGVNYTNEVPKQNYEVTLEAMRVEGEDFFCGLTFPIGDSCSSLVLGGWGGSTTGISSVDGQDASENETSQEMHFETGHWYRIRLRVSEQKLEAWVGPKKIVDIVRAGHKFSLYASEIKQSKPFGLASWTTTAAFRDIKIRDVTGPADQKP
jgi:hypothetical protein